MQDDFQRQPVVQWEQYWRLLLAPSGSFETNRALWQLFERLSAQVVAATFPAYARDFSFWILDSVIYVITFFFVTAVSESAALVVANVYHPPKQAEFKTWICILHHRHIMKHAKSASDASRISTEVSYEWSKYIKMIGCDIIIDFMLKMVVRGITLVPTSLATRIIL